MGICKEKRTWKQCQIWKWKFTNSFWCVECLEMMQWYKIFNVKLATLLAINWNWNAQTESHLTVYSTHMNLYHVPRHCFITYYFLLVPLTKLVHFTCLRQCQLLCTCNHLLAPISLLCLPAKSNPGHRVRLALPSPPDGTAGWLCVPHLL